MAKKAGTSVVRWDEEMAKEAALHGGMEASLATGSFLSARGGVLSFQGNAIKDNKLQCIFLDWPVEYKWFSVDFDPDTPRSPDCYAFGRETNSGDTIKDVEMRMTPHDKAQLPQAEHCYGCKWNEFNTANRGEGKACRNTRRLALIDAEALKEGPEGIERAKVVYFAPPVTSVRAWAGYVTAVRNMHRRLPHYVVTELVIVPDKKNQFAAQFVYVGKVTDEAILAALKARREKQLLETEFAYPPNSDEPKAKKGARAPAGKSGTAPRGRPAPAPRGAPTTGRRF